MFLGRLKPAQEHDWPLQGDHAAPLLYGFGCSSGAGHNGWRYPSSFCRCNCSGRKFGLVDGMPFILGDDGSYDHDLNRFFRACPTMGVRSLNSLRSYARDILVWLRFLAERRGGKSVWAADREDVAAYHEARRLSVPPHRIGGIVESLRRGARQALPVGGRGEADRQGAVHLSPDVGSRDGWRCCPRCRECRPRAGRAER
jgi:hypothetical protein